MKLLLIPIAIIALKFLLNLQHWLRIKRLKEYFLEFICGKRNDMNRYRNEVISLFKKAYVPDVYTPVVDSVGLGLLASGNVSLFTMFPSKRAAFIAEYLNMFDSAEGTFYKNMSDAINPLYWVETVVFLPKTILRYIGLDSDKTAFKLCNVLLSFIWWALCLCAVFFKPQLKQLLIEALGNLQ